MAKSSVIVSDITQAVLAAEQHVQVVIKEVEGGATWVLDAGKEEVADLINVGTKQKRRGRPTSKATQTTVAAAAPEPEPEPVAEPEPALV